MSDYTAIKTSIPPLLSVSPYTEAELKALADPLPLAVCVYSTDTRKFYLGDGQTMFEDLIAINELATIEILKELLEQSLSQDPGNALEMRDDGLYCPTAQILLSGEGRMWEITGDGESDEFALPNASSQKPESFLVTRDVAIASFPAASITTVVKPQLGYAMIGQGRIKFTQTPVDGETFQIRELGWLPLKSVTPHDPLDGLNLIGTITAEKLQQQREDMSTTQIAFPGGLPYSSSPDPDPYYSASGLYKDVVKVRTLFYPINNFSMMNGISTSGQWIQQKFPEALKINRVTMILNDGAAGSRVSTVGGSYIDPTTQQLVSLGNQSYDYTAAKPQTFQFGDVESSGFRITTVSGEATYFCIIGSFTAWVHRAWLENDTVIVDGRVYVVVVDNDKKEFVDITDSEYVDLKDDGTLFQKIDDEWVERTPLT
ncbi:hypothetical protein C4J81_03830 [Deltaproteobacteria bacterium Smac51]|nr:hypothetical protein C4J81_03830 [Deltaproteobacteria bacterium Smac51]